MSGTQMPRLEAYRQRENNFLGRMVNMAIDAGRGLVGQNPVWMEAMLIEEKLAQAKARAPDVTEKQVAAANTPPRDFTSMITDALEASGLEAKDQERALSVIDNATVYLHQADPAGRLDRTATPGSISAEWNQLGITEEQAAEMVNKAVAYSKEGLRVGQVADTMAAEMTQGVDREEPDLSRGFHYIAAGEEPASWGLAPVAAQKADVDQFIDALTSDLAAQGFTVREVNLEQDNEPHRDRDLGLGL